MGGSSSKSDMSWVYKDLPDDKATMVSRAVAKYLDQVDTTSESTGTAVALMVDKLVDPNLTTELKRTLFQASRQLCYLDGDQDPKNSVQGGAACSYVLARDYKRTELDKFNKEKKDVVKDLID